MKTATILSVCAALVGTASVVKADFITGDLDVAGRATFNNSALGSATAVDTVITSVSLGGDGILGDVSAVTFNIPPTWTLTGSAPIANFADLTLGSGLTFYLSQSINTPSPGYANVAGFGTLTGDGYSPTVVEFTFTASGAGPTTSYSATFTAIPDGGTTVVLLGGALIAVGLIRRKMVA